MPSGKKRKRHKIATIKRKKRRRANRYKKGDGGFKGQGSGNRPG